MSKSQSSTIGLGPDDGCEDLRRSTISSSSHSTESECASLKHKLATKEMELVDLVSQHSKVVSEKDLIESQMKAMQERANQADERLSELKAESEAYVRQSESDRQELAIMRRRSLVGGGGQIITQMYETILHRYEQLNVSHEDLRKRLAEETEIKTKLQKQLESIAVQKPDKESMIRQLELMNERVESLQRDLTRVREERTMFKREYSLVMSERDSVHQDMNKLQEDLTRKEEAYRLVMDEKVGVLEQNAKLQNEITVLQSSSTTHEDLATVKQELYAAQCERKQALLEKEVQLQEAYNARKAHDIAMETIEQTARESEALRAKLDIVKQELREAKQEAENATKYRTLAFSERDKLAKELEENRRVLDSSKSEREKLVKQLEEAVKEHDSTKETKNKILVELREMKSRIELSQRENTHSHDSAIDAGEWESQSQDGAVQVRRLMRVLPRQRDVTVELAPFIKYSSCLGVQNGDRIVAVNDVATDGKDAYQIEEMMRAEICVLRMERSYSVAESESSREEIIKDLGDHFHFNHRKSSSDKIWNNTTSNQHQNGTETNGLPRDDVTYRTVADGDSPVHAPISAGPVNVRRKKPKISGLFRKRKSKSVIETSSTGGSNGGTWPRRDSPSLSSIVGPSGGRLSVFIRGGKNRPSITSNTFTPPGGHSAGHTPPTAIRASANISSASPNSIHTSPPRSPSPASDSLTSRSSNSHPVAPARPRARLSRRSGVVRKRPQSAPMTPAKPLSVAPTEVNSNNNNTTSPTHWKHDVTSKQRQVTTSPSPSHDATYSTVTASGTASTSRPSVVVTPGMGSKTPSSERSKFVYGRQQSYTEGTSQTSISISSASVARTPTTRPKTCSLPRPSSARAPTFSVTSHPIDTHKSWTQKDFGRIRIPSEASVRCFEKGSITFSSDRSTPAIFPPDPPASRSTTDASTSSLSVGSGMSSRSRRPTITQEPRLVTMIKGVEPIGISIVRSGDNSGIFVSRVAEHSLAAKARLEYGDQLLEYNGINLRNAREELARVIMSQTQPGDTIEILAQYNAEKYQQQIESNIPDTLGVAQAKRDTPQLVTDEREEGTITPDATPRASPHVEDTLRSQRMTDPRFVFMRNGLENVKLIGGNACGIYIASIQSNEDTLTPSASDLRIGDRIIELNSTHFDNTTLEGASIMMSQCLEGASLQVVYEPNKYKQIYGRPGDHFYVRALFDHVTDREDALHFVRNSILLVENTYPEYTPGEWLAWLVDEQGGKSSRGRIPSKITVERERENSSVFDDVTSMTGSTSGKRFGGSGRRSLFKRRKPHRTSSRSSGDVRLNKSVSETSIESVDPHSEHLVAYQVVEKHCSDIRRPVIVFGPHSAMVVERLAREHSGLFVKCSMEQMKGTDHESGIIETYTQSAETLVLTGNLLKRTMKQFPDRHVLLEISADAIDRLYTIDVYPIITFVKYQSSKKIKESQDRSYAREKLSGKQCKEIMERANSIEKKLMSKYYGTVSINGGQSGIVANKISKVVSHEHSKVLWLPSKNNPLKY